MKFEIETPRNLPHELPDKSVPTIPTGPVRIQRNWVTDLTILENSTGFHQGPRQNRKGAHLIIWSWAAALIDGCLVMGLGLLFLVSFLLIVKSQWGVVAGQGHDFLFVSLAAVLGSLSFFYVIMLRSLLGFTLGEWACGLRLGSPRQRSAKDYTLRVLLRSVLLFATGIVLLPLLSLLLRQDLPGKISGLSLFSLR